MDMQALIDGMSDQWMRERAETQMTLGKLIERLESLPPTLNIGLGDAHSYRGYYSDLAFEPTSPVPVKELLQECKDSMGACFHGYKGGIPWLPRGGKAAVDMVAASVLTEYATVEAQA